MDAGYVIPDNPLRPLRSSVEFLLFVWFVNFVGESTGQPADDAWPIRFHVRGGEIR